MEIPQEVIDYFLKFAKNMTLEEKALEEGGLYLNSFGTYEEGMDDGRIEYARAFLDLYVPGWREM